MTADDIAEARGANCAPFLTTCPDCGAKAYLMRRPLHPKIKGEIPTFECKDCGKQTEKSVLHYDQSWNE